MCRLDDYNVRNAHAGARCGEGPLWFRSGRLGRVGDMPTLPSKRTWIPITTRVRFALFPGIQRGRFRANSAPGTDH